MKKHLLFIALAGLMTLAACNKDKESQGVAQFTATIEHQGGRTSLDPNNGQINWTAGDQIVIGNDDNETAVFNLQSGEGTTEGGFGTSGEFNTVGPFIAAYPETATIANDVVTFNLPATQTIGETGTFGNGANPMVACSDDKNLQFKNLCGGLGIRLKGVGAHVSSVRITSKNTEEKLWGAYEVSNCAANEPTLTVASDNQGTNVITLNCDVTLTTAAKTFFVMLPPGTLANGFTMEVLDGNEVLTTKETTTDIALVERNSVKCFNEILIDVEFDGNVEIPTGMSNTDIIVTNLGEDAVPDENGDFFIGYSKMLTAKNATNNEIIYMSVLSVDYDIAKGENQLQSYDLNAKETALYYALTMIPFGLNQAKDETFQSIKDVLYDLDCVQALETAIGQSVNQNGYLRAEDIGDELNAVWNYLRDELLAPFLDKQSSNSGSYEGRIVLKKDGTSRLEQPQIQPNNGRLSGIRLDIESASFNETSNTWTLNLTGYSDNGVFIGINKGSIVDGLAHPTGGRTPYFIPPMNVGKFMGTFTSLGGLKDYFVDTWHLFFEEGFGFDDMTWDKAKLQDISFELSSNEDALLMYSPRDDQPTAAVNGVYVIMQGVGIGLDAILTKQGYSEFFTSLFANQELCATVAGVVEHPENFTTAAVTLLGWAADLFSTEAFRQFINPKYNVDKILEKIASSATRALVTWVGNGLGTLASWYLFDSFAFAVEAEYSNEPVVLPDLFTNSYNVISSTRATVTGTLASAGTYSIVERGICYSTSQNPTINAHHVPAEGTGIGAFTCTLDGLSPYTTYYARSYAKNNMGNVAYGSNEVSFRTYSAVPVITTYPVNEETDITSTTVVFHAKVDEVPSSTIWMRGFFYSTSPQVYYENPGVLSVDAMGGGTGEFSATATGLTPNTTYYFVPYVITYDERVFHGPEKHFNTLNSGGGGGGGNGNAPTGAINGLFTINANGDQVYFSQGNLQYQASTNTWRFAEHQWDYVGGTVDGTEYGTVYVNGVKCDNSQVSSFYSGWIDLFGWGTSNWNCNTYYRPWDTDGSDWYGGRLYGPSGENNMTGSYSNCDWGHYNAITNGGNEAGLWRTPTQPEWEYIFNVRSTISGIRFAKAIVDGVYGVILVPDNWSESNFMLNNYNQSEVNFNGNSITLSDWMSVFEANGAVFLPAAGNRIGLSFGLFDMPSWGDYWSASHIGSYSARDLDIQEYHIYTDSHDQRGWGRSVRLVRNAE